jgi:NlpC/P60 family
MLQRVNPIVLISLIAVLILSLAIFAAAKPGGGSPDAALGAAMGQVGMPYGFGTDGPGSFSCTGLVRHALRSAGVDPNAPWDHMAYLSVYPTVSEPQPGDVVVYPDGAAMYAGGGQIVMANHADGAVGTYGMNDVGTPVGFARPYGGTLDPAASDPAAVKSAEGPAIDPAAVDPAAVDPMIVDPVVDPALADPALADPALVDPALADPVAVDPAVAEPVLDDPVAVDPALVDPEMVY